MLKVIFHSMQPVESSLCITLNAIIFVNTSKANSCIKSVIKKMLPVDHIWHVNRVRTLPYQNSWPSIGEIAQCRIRTNRVRRWRESLID